MKISRRNFLQITGLAAGASMLPMPVKWLGTGKAEAFIQSPNTIPLYGGPFRAAEIPVAIPIPQAAATALGAPQLAEGALDDDATGFPLTFPKNFPPSDPPYGAPKTGVRHYTLTVQQFQDKILPDSCYAGSGAGANGTTLYGFKPALTLLEGLGFLGAIPPQSPFYYHPVSKPQPQKHLGGIMLWEGGPGGKPVQFTMKNNLPLKHILPNDLTVPGANQGDDRWTTHVHGGLMPWICDGGPFDWYCSQKRSVGAREKGKSCINNNELRVITGNAAYDALYPVNSMTEAEFYMNPDKQSARMIWYHDHAFGITRINAYAGAASAIIIRDDFERAMIPEGLPPLLESSLLKVLGVSTDVNVPAVVQELPIVFQDKIFTGSNIKVSDPTWPGPVYPGSIWYPHVYEGTRWRRLSTAKTMPQQSVIAEMFGDTMLINGSYSPTLQVEPRRYRFRLLNACNARFLNLQLYVAQYNTLSNPPQPAELKAAPYVDNQTGITLNAAPDNTPKNTKYTNPITGGNDWVVLGYECGFLTKVQAVPCATPYASPDDSSSTEQISLLLGSAERPDVILDFSGYDSQDIILYNDAAGPFPGSAGDDRNDYMPGLINGNVINTGRNRPAKDTDARNTRCLMRFQVRSKIGGVPNGKLNKDNQPELVSGPVDKLWNLPVGTSLVGREVPPAQMWAMEPDRFTQSETATYSIGTDGFGGIGGPNWTSIDGTAIARYNKLGLFEEFDPYGRLQQAVGSLSSYAHPPAYSAIAESVDFATNGDTEVWAIYNTTADVHPMHFHMSNWSVIGRQAHNTISGSYQPTGDMFPPRPWELGYKEVVLCYPNEIAYIMAKWNIPPIYGPKMATPKQPAYSPRGIDETPSFEAHETVWHCHILEHEEHDMMRPVWITGIPSFPVGSQNRADGVVVSSADTNFIVYGSSKTIKLTGHNLATATLEIPGCDITNVVRTGTTFEATVTTNLSATIGHKSGTVSLGNGSKSFFYLEIQAV